MGSVIDLHHTDQSSSLYSIGKFIFNVDDTDTKFYFQCGEYLE